MMGDRCIYGGRRRGSSCTAQDTTPACVCSIIRPIRYRANTKIGVGCVT